MADLKLPIESHVLQAFVSEGLKPFIDGVVTFGAGHFYVSQSDKGGLVFGGDIDGYNSYAQRGNLATVEHVAEAGVAMIPALSRVRVLRSWGGVMDMSMDGSPIIDRTPIDNLYLNAGWCYGGFKATPASGFCFAHLLARNAAARDGARLPPRPVRARLHNRRKGRRRPTQPSLRTLYMASLVACPHCGLAPQGRIHRSRGAALPRPAPDAGEEHGIDYVYLRDNPRGRYERILAPHLRLPPLAGGDARYGDP